MKYDVVVAGAGPAGSATARQIAKAGFKVLVVEKRVAVGQPAMCSGLVTPRTLEVAGLQSASRLVLNEIKGAVVRSPSGGQLNLGGDKTYALAVDRAALDSELAEQAEEAGADLLVDTSLNGIVRDGRYLKLSTSRNGIISEIDTKLLIGADGVGSSVARWAGVRDANGLVRAVAAEGWLEDGSSDRAEVFVGSTVAPGWFGWIIPLGDGRVRIGTGDGSHGNLPARQLLARMMAGFPSRFRRARIGRFWVKGIPLYSPSQTYADNVLLVGDAARQVKPTSGGGIYTGLVGARHCAKVAIASLENADFSAAFLSRYQTAWEGELAAELDRCLDLRRVFTSLSDEELDRLMAILNNAWLQKMIIRFGDIDTPSSVVEQLVRAAPVLRLFLHASIDFPYRWAADLLSVFARSRGGSDVLCAPSAGRAGCVD